MAEEIVRALLVENLPALYKDKDADYEGDSSDKYCSHCASWSIFHVFGMSECYVDHNAEADAYAETDGDVEEIWNREWYGCLEDSRTIYLPYLSAKLNNQPPVPLKLNGTEDTGNDKDTTAAEPGLETTEELLEIGAKVKTSSSETFGSASYHTPPEET